MEEFVDNFYSYDFAGNLVNDEDEDDESVDFDTVVIEEGEKFKDSSSDDEHEGKVTVMKRKWTYQEKYL